MIDESFHDGPECRDLADAFGRLSISRGALLTELGLVRPAEHAPDVLPIEVRGADGKWIGQRRPTARLRMIEYRARDEARRAAVEVNREGAAEEPVHVLDGLLGEDDGPAALALRHLGVPPSEARWLLGIPDPRPVHVLPALWLPPRQPQESSWPGGGAHAILPGDPPSPGSRPCSFVWTGEDQELELSAGPGGCIRLRVRSDTETVVEICTEAAEVMASYLADFKAQLDAERYEPMFEAERRGETKPPAL